MGGRAGHAGVERDCRKERDERARERRKKVGNDRTYKKEKERKKT